jgi:mono/diheme cytochrome c family protein
MSSDDLRPDGTDLDRHEGEPGAVIDIHEPIYREQAEPKDGYEPVPLWLMFAALTLMGFGGWYLGMYSGGFRADVYDEQALLKGGLAPVAKEAAAPVDPMVLGKRVYNNCMACHQADGQGVAGNYPPLIGSRWVTGRPGVFAALLLHGLEGEIEVNGEIYNGVMPPWDHLGDEQLASVMTYVRGSWGNAADPVSSDLVAAVRAATEGRRGAMKVADLEAFAAEFVPPATAPDAAADAAPAPAADADADAAPDAAADAAAAPAADAAAAPDAATAADEG